MIGHWPRHLQGCCRSGEVCVPKFPGAGSEFSRFKETLAEVAVAKLAPIADERSRILSDVASLDAVLRRGAERANAIAQPNLAAIKDLVGLLRP